MENDRERIGYTNDVEDKVMESTEEFEIKNGNKYLNVIKEVIIHCANPKGVANL